MKIGKSNLFDLLGLICASKSLYYLILCVIISTRDPMVWSEAGGLSCTQEYRGKVKVWFGYKEGRVVFLSNSHEHDIHPDLMPSFFEVYIISVFRNSNTYINVRKVSFSVKLFLDVKGFASVMQYAKTPRRFVEDFPQEAVEAFNLQLLVADINTGSLVYVSKDERRLRVNDVGHGVHTISVYGFDACILRVL